MMMKVYNTVLICASHYVAYINVVCMHTYLHDHYEHLNAINSSDLTLPDDHIHSLFNSLYNACVYTIILIGLELVL